VVTNLVDNAVKFSPSGGTIHLSLRTADAQACVEVVDEGIGIGPGDQARIFDRFVQLDGGNSRRKGGAGLGLSIARGIVEAHGGRIGVESHAGEGSTFYFTLPCEGTATPTA
jgi:signal transduction histidine kinase